MMNIPRNILITFSLLVFSANAAAIMVEGKPHAMDMSIEEVRTLLSEHCSASGPCTKKENKHVKKAQKKLKKLFKVHNKMQSADQDKMPKLEKKFGKKEKKLLKALARLDLDLSPFLDNDLPGGDNGAGNGNGDNGNVQEVPEPSAIMLLGIGLAGFAAARRFRRSA